MWGEVRRPAWLPRALPSRNLAPARLFLKWQIRAWRWQGGGGKGAAGACEFWLMGPGVGIVVQRVSAHKSTIRFISFFFFLMKTALEAFAGWVACPGPVPPPRPGWLLSLPCLSSVGQWGLFVSFRFHSPPRFGPVPRRILLRLFCLFKTQTQTSGTALGFSIIQDKPLESSPCLET